MPQTRFQCGPAALAMVLSWMGYLASADALIRQVYSSGRHGSLPTDMIGAARRQNPTEMKLGNQTTSTSKVRRVEFGDSGPAQRV